MVTQIAEKMAYWLASQTGQMKEIQRMRYSLEILMAGLFKMFCLFFGAYLLNVYVEMLFLVLTFSSLRLLSGGFHLSTYSRCLIAGMVLMIGFAYVSGNFPIVLSKNMMASWLLLSVIFGFISCYKYAPSSHYYRKLTERRSDFLKKGSLLGIIFWGTILFLLLPHLSQSLMMASILGFLLQMWSIYPSSYRIIQWLETKLDKEVIRS